MKYEWIFIIIFWIIINFLDILSTAIGLFKGYREGNPIFAYFIKNNMWYIGILLKFSFIVFIILVIGFQINKHPETEKFYYMFLSGANLLYLWVVSMNFA